MSVWIYLVEHGGTIQVYNFRVEFASPAENEDENDGEDTEQESEEREIQYKKLIHIKVKWVYIIPFKIIHIFK